MILTFLATVWLLALAAMVPEIEFSMHEGGHSPTWRDWAVAAAFLFIFALPALVVLGLTARKWAQIRRSS